VTFAKLPSTRFRQKAPTPVVKQEIEVKTKEISSQVLPFVCVVWRVAGKEGCDLEAEDTTTIPKFYFTQYDNITGRGSEALSEETPRAERSLFGGFGQLPP
jgi:hypothetical protein